MLLLAVLTCASLRHTSHPMSQLVLQALLRAAVTKTTSSNTGVTPSAGMTVADPAVQQLAQALVHDGTSTACHLHDSAASESCTYADHISCRAEFLTRRHTANINEAAHIFRAAAKPAADQAERAFVQMPPFEARKTFLLGAPKPACCPERSKTAEGINKLRQTVDPDIGRQPRISCSRFSLTLTFRRCCREVGHSFCITYLHFNSAMSQHSYLTLYEQYPSTMTGSTLCICLRSHAEMLSH